MYCIDRSVQFLILTLICKRYSGARDFEFFVLKNGINLKKTTCYKFSEKICCSQTSLKKKPKRS